MNRIKLDLPKDHHFDAVCIGVSAPNPVSFATNQVIHIKAKGRGKYSRTNLDKYVFPRSCYSRQKTFFGFQTGDTIKAIVPRGKYKGVWFGAVSCRKSGSFDIKNKEGKRMAQGINQKYFRVLQRTDGYEYSIEQYGIPPALKQQGFLPVTCELYACTLRI